MKTAVIGTILVGLFNLTICYVLKTETEISDRNVFDRRSKFRKQEIAGHKLKDSDFLTIKAFGKDEAVFPSEASVATVAPREKSGAKIPKRRRNKCRRKKQRNGRDKKKRKEKQSKKHKKDRKKNSQKLRKLRNHFRVWQSSPSNQDEHSGKAIQRLRRRRRNFKPVYHKTSKTLKSEMKKSLRHYHLQQQNKKSSTKNSDEPRYWSNSIGKLQKHSTNESSFKNRRNMSRFLIPVTFITSRGLSKLPINPDIRVTIRVMEKNRKTNHSNSVISDHIHSESKSALTYDWSSSADKFRKVWEKKYDYKRKRQRDIIQDAIKPNSRKTVDEDYVNNEKYVPDEYYHSYEYDYEGGSVLPTSGSFDFKSDFQWELDPKLVDMNIDWEPLLTTMAPASGHSSYGGGVHAGILSTVLNFFSEEGRKMFSKDSEGGEQSQLPNKNISITDNKQSSFNITTSFLSSVKNKSWERIASGHVDIPFQIVQNNDRLSVKEPHILWSKRQQRNHIDVMFPSIFLQYLVNRSAVSDMTVIKVNTDNSVTKNANEYDTNRNHSEWVKNSLLPTSDERAVLPKELETNKGTSVFKMTDTERIIQEGNTSTASKSTGKLHLPKDIVADILTDLERLAAKVQQKDDHISSSVAEDLCTKWQSSMAENLLQEKALLHFLPSCPCSYPDELVYNDIIYDKILNNSFRWRPLSKDKELTDVLHRGAHQCIRSLAFEQGASLAAQTCCYDGARALITRGSGAGFPSVVSPEISPGLHYLFDVTPWKACRGNFKRFHSFRHPNNGLNCTTNPDEATFRHQQLEAADY